MRLHPIASAMAWRVVIPAVILSVGVSVGLGAGYALKQTHVACADRQAGWDNRRDAWIELTMPTPFEPTADPERHAAELAINAQNELIRRNLLAGLGERPDC